MKLKKLLALVLALALVLSGSVVAFAEDEDDANEGQTGQNDGGADYSQADLAVLAGIFSSFWDQLPKDFTNGKSPEDLTNPSESGDAWWKDLSYEYEDDDVYYYIGISWEDAGEGTNRVIGLSLDSLDLKGSLDVSALDELVMLDCGYNQLTSLKVPDSLELLYCYNNQLRTLDVSKCTGLITLSCGFNQLTSLNVSNCTGLRILSCYNNQLTSLDLSKCRELITLNAPYNQLTSLDVSGCSKLTYLDCRNNNLPSKNAVKLAPSLNVVWDEGTYDEYGIIRTGFLFTPQGGYIPAAPVPQASEEPKENRDESNRQAEEAAMEAVEAAMEAIREGKTPAKVQNATTAAGASIPAVPVKLYGIGASLSVDSMNTLSDGSVGLKVTLDNGAAEILIPPGFTPAGRGVLYYPIGLQQDPLRSGLLKSLVKGDDAKTEVYRLGGGSLPTAATVTIKTKLKGAVNIYRWDEDARRITLLATATAENGKVIFATKQIGNLIITTGAI